MVFIKKTLKKIRKSDTIKILGGCGPLDHPNLLFTPEKGILMCHVLILETEILVKVPVPEAAIFLLRTSRMFESKSGAPHKYVPLEF